VLIGQETASYTAVHFPACYACNVKSFHLKMVGDIKYSSSEGAAEHQNNKDMYLS